MMHRQETVECLRKFNARRKLKVGFSGFKPALIGYFFFYPVVLKGWDKISVWKYTIFLLGDVIYQSTLLLKDVGALKIFIIPL